MTKENLTVIDGDSIIYMVTYNKPDEIPKTIQAMFCEVDQIIDDIMIQTESKLYCGFLSDKYTFRHKVATVKEYKGNRKEFIKPKYFNLVKSYLMDEYRFLIQKGYEADDWCIITSRLYSDRYNVIISSPDKDLRQIPGIFYDYKKSELFTVTPEQAEYNLWYQVLVGDSGDHVGGCKGIGKVKGEKLLNSFVGDYASGVLKTYMSIYGDYDGICCFSENYKLVKMLEKPLEEEFLAPPLTAYLSPERLDVPTNSVLDSW